MTDEVKDLLAADVGPDDPEVGTADDVTKKDVADKPEVPAKPEVDKGVSTTETTDAPAAQPDPPAGQPEAKPEAKPDEKPDETPEDVEKSRAYFQEKSQKEIELRKALQEDLDKMTTDLQAADPSVNFDVGYVPEVPAVEPPAVAPASEYVDPDDLDVTKLTKDVANSVVGMLGDRERAQRQHKIDVAFKNECANVVASFTGFIEKHEVPNKIADAAIKYSRRMVPEDVLGAPTRRIELAGDYIQREMTKVAVTEQRELATKANDAADDKKIEAAKALAQPASGPISPPAPMTPEALNDKLADDFAPDDAFD